MINPSCYTTLFDTLNSAIGTALTNRFLYEPQLVANLLVQITQQVNRTKLHGVSVESRGIFVHQQPLVRFTCPPSLAQSTCEIGDLLVLRAERRGGVLRSRSAILFQAKKENRFPVRPDDNFSQYYLYTTWPPFEYVHSPSSLDGQFRHITGRDIGVGAKYLLLRDQPTCAAQCQSCAITARPLVSVLSRPECLASELTTFILGHWGKPFTYPALQGSHGWSRVMQDLIDNTGKQLSVYMGRAINGRSKAPRMCFLTGEPETGWLWDTSIHVNQAWYDADQEALETLGDEQRDDGSAGLSILGFVVTDDEESGAR